MTENAPIHTEIRIGAFSHNIVLKDLPVFKSRVSIDELEEGSEATTILLRDTVYNK